MMITRIWKHALLLVALFSTSSLAGCDWFANEDWKKTYGTPELFLLQAEVKESYIYPNDEKDNKGPDTNYEIKEALMASRPFENTEKTKSTVGRYFTYEIFISSSTAGPNYCTMGVYDDGFMVIDHKSALGPHQYAYFTIEASNAKTINDRVREKIPSEASISQEDHLGAQKEGDIEHFFLAMEQEKAVPVTVREVKNDEWIYHQFYDGGGLLNVMKQADYRPSDATPVDSWMRVKYNDVGSDSKKLRWTYALDDDYQHVRVDYEYRNRLEQEKAVSLVYEIDKAAGEAIYEKAMQMAN